MYFGLPYNFFQAETNVHSVVDEDQNFSRSVCLENCLNGAITGEREIGLDTSADAETMCKQLVAKELTALSVRGNEAKRKEQ